MSDSIRKDAHTTEAVPEPDCLEGFAHPRFQQEFVGNAQAESALIDAALANRLHHAWLFAGPDGVGKATLAYRFGRFLLAKRDDSEDTGTANLDIGADTPVFRQVAALAHPNLLVLRRPWQEKTKRLANEITVGEVRRLRSFFSHTAGEGEWRVVIIDQAQELNSAAANALLKSLEEPPERCVFLLVCSAPGRLPVTIRSRCRTLKFVPLDDADLARAVQSAYAVSGSELPSDASIRDCIPLAQGSVGRALRLLDGGGSALHERLMKLIASLPRLDYVEVHAFADELTAARAGGSYDLFFDLVCESISRIVAHGATGSGGIGVEADMALRLNGAGALAKFAGLWETVRRAKAEADALNLDRKNLVLGTFFRLEETAREVFV